MSRDLDEELKYRQAALEGLENDDEALEMIQKRRHMNRTARIKAENGEVGITRHGDDTTFGAGGDELDNADFLLRKMQHADGLQGKVALRQQQWQGLHDRAAFTRPNPPSVLHGILGNQAIVFAGGPVLEVANWGGEDAETSPVTVTAMQVQRLINDGAKPTSAQTFRPFVRVKFGTKGFLAELEADILFGTQFTISGSVVIVQVGMDPPKSTGGTSDPTDLMKLAAELSFWPIVRTKPVTRTVYVDNDGGNGPIVGTQLVDVPNFAKDVTVVADQVGIKLDFFADGGGLVAYTFTTASSVTFLPILLSGDIRQIQVTPANGAKAIRLVFGLDV